MTIFDNLKPSSLWKHFEKILTIPHCSGNEKALGEYIISVAEANNLEWNRDKVGNVVVSKNAMLLNLKLKENGSRPKEPLWAQTTALE